MIPVRIEINLINWLKFAQLFHDGDRYRTETSPLANQWTGFYMITASVLKGLIKNEQSRQIYIRYETNYLMS